MNARTVFAALALALASVRPAQSHRLDEYLQTTRLDVSPHRVAVEIDLTPGAAIAAEGFATIDQNADRRVTGPEIERYAGEVLRDVALTVDERQIALNLTRAACPSWDEIRDGDGTIQLHAVADIPWLGGGRHRLHYENQHRSASSVYLVNLLVPSTRAVVLGPPRRDARQVTIDADVEIATPYEPALWSLVAGAIGAMAYRTYRRRRRARLTARAALALAAFLAVPAIGAAQTPQTAPDAAAPEYPSLRFSGFANIDVSAQDKSEGPRGFSEGQFVLHLASALSPRVNVFGELSFSPRTDAGTGSPAATGFNAEVERIIIRFDHSDQLKVSFGRYHTPINWWNTAFHHGQWLQTTVTRPEMVQFGGRFIPVHFVGALVEGGVPAGGVNISYQAGIGNGRGNVISRAGDAGDVNARPAYVLTLFARPDRAFGLQVGGSLYLDRVSVTGRPEFDERIVSGHAVWQREDPEIIGEIAHVRHEEIGGVSPATSNLAYYVQAAYRLPDRAHAWKPYYRFEHIDIDSADTVFAAVPNLDGSTIGIRYDLSTYAAVKTEARLRRRAADEPRANGWFLQIAFTF